MFTQYILSTTRSILGALAWCLCLTSMVAVGCVPFDQGGNETGDDDDFDGGSGDDDDDHTGDDPSGSADREDLVVDFDCHDCLGGPFSGGEDMEWDIYLSNEGDVDVRDPFYAVWLLGEQYQDQVCDDGNLAGVSGYVVRESNLSGTDCDPIEPGDTCKVSTGLDMPNAQPGTYFWMVFAVHDGGDDDPYNNIDCSPADVEVD